MSRQILDGDLLLWEVFPTGGELGFSADPYVIFHCTSRPDLRPRRLATSGHEASAERVIRQASDDELLAMLQRSAALP